MLAHVDRLPAAAARRRPLVW